MPILFEFSISLSRPLATMCIENEVSGAVLLHSDVSQNSVISLKLWLECRGILTKGNKTELVKFEKGQCVISLVMGFAPRLALDLLLDGI